MPNWVYNHITMSKKDYLEKKHLFINENGEFDFNLLVPRSVRANADDGAYDGFLTNIHNHEEEYEENAEKFSSFDNLTEDFFDNFKGEKAILVSKKGWKREDGWYEWQIENWGTKWNADDQGIDDSEDDFVHIQFNTAWSAPEPVFNALAKIVDFSCSGDEEGGFFEYEGEGCDGEFDIRYEEPEPEDEDEDEEE